jgi:DNA-binding XRE family transcriptional regulator
MATKRTMPTQGHARKHRGGTAGKASGNPSRKPAVTTARVADGVVVVIDGVEHVAVPVAEYRRLIDLASDAPTLPKPDRKGRVNAVDYGRASIARELVNRRKLAGMTQADLADASGVRVETISRIEGGKHSARGATLDKLDASLTKAEKARK